MKTYKTSDKWIPLCTYFIPEKPGTSLILLYDDLNVSEVFVLDSRKTYDHSNVIAYKTLEFEGV